MRKRQTSRMWLQSTVSCRKRSELRCGILTPFFHLQSVVDGGGGGQRRVIYLHRCELQHGDSEVNLLVFPLLKC